MCAAFGREIASVLRKVARTVGEGSAAPVHVGADQVRQFLGQPRFYEETIERLDRPGVATGLAWMPSGGHVLFVGGNSHPQ